ncbi:hypothetical protein ACWGR4_30855 [Embleya sp. NPDC055664]
MLAVQRAQPLLSEHLVRHRAGRVAVGTLALLDAMPFVLFFAVLYIHHPTWENAMLSATSFSTAFALRQCMLNLASWINVQAADAYIAAPHRTIREVHDTGALAGAALLARLHRPHGLGPDVRVFDVRMKTRALEPDTTFVNYVGTSFIFVIGLDGPDGHLKRFRVLHEFGHVSNAAVRLWKREFSGPIQIGALALLVVFFPTGMVTDPVLCWGFAAFAVIVTAPFGPNRHNDAREHIADTFAIAHMPPDQARRAVYDHFTRLLADTLHRLNSARRTRDYTRALEVAEPFYIHPDVKVLDLVRPSYYLSRSLEWRLSYSAALHTLRTRAAEAVAECRSAGEVDTDRHARARPLVAPGWWQVQPLATIPLVIALGLQVDHVATRVWMFLLAAPVVLWFVAFLLQGRVASWERRFNLRYEWHHGLFAWLSGSLAALGETRADTAAETTNEKYGNLAQPKPNPPTPDFGETRPGTSAETTSEKEPPREPWGEAVRAVLPGFTLLTMLMASLPTFTHRWLSTTVMATALVAYPTLTFAISRSLRRLYASIAVLLAVPLGIAMAVAVYWAAR